MESDSSSSGSSAGQESVESDSGSDNGMQVPTVPQYGMQVPTVPTATLFTPLHELARRERFDVDHTRANRARYCITGNNVPLPQHALDFCRIQDIYDALIVKVYEQCSKKFWDFFLPFHTFSGRVVDTALRTVKRLFRDNKRDRKFPGSRRTLLDKLSCIDDFWSHVRHSARIDVRSHNLPSGTQFIQFEFVDPCWAWIVSARRQSPECLHWRPAPRDGPQPFYGGGIEYGECFFQAYKQCPPGSFNMWITLHWDGTFGKGLGCTPIAVGNANTNVSDTSKEFTIAYVPTAPDQRMPEYAKTPRCTE